MTATEQQKAASSRKWQRRQPLQGSRRKKETDPYTSSYQYAVGAVAGTCRSLQSRPQVHAELLSPLVAQQLFYVLDEDFQLKGQSYHHGVSVIDDVQQCLPGFTAE